MLWNHVQLQKIACSCNRKSQHFQLLRHCRLAYKQFFQVSRKIGKKNEQKKSPAPGGNQNHDLLSQRLCYTRCPQKVYTIATLIEKTDGDKFFIENVLYLVHIQVRLDQVNGSFPPLLKHSPIFFGGQKRIMGCRLVEIFEKYAGLLMVFLRNDEKNQLNFQSATKNESNLLQLVSSFLSSQFLFHF